MWRHQVNYNALQKIGLFRGFQPQRPARSATGVPTSPCRQCLLPENREGAGSMHLAGKLRLV